MEFSICSRLAWQPKGLGAIKRMSPVGAQHKLAYARAVRRRVLSNVCINLDHFFGMPAALISWPYRAISEETKLRN